VRGLVEAMGGTVRARRSQLGGLAIDVLLPAATPMPEVLGADTGASSVTRDVA
jgi:hypothetical protein